MGFMEFCMKPKRVSTRQWCKPSFEVVKLNTNECSFGNLGYSGGSGLLRDHAGNLIAAYYGHCSNNHAELLAVCDGIRLAMNRGVSKLWVEVDSMMVLHWFQTKICKH
ncbi:hypothetical protein REPUB_Repub05bG0119300 [Reevesia pubescens]